MWDIIAGTLIIAIASLGTFALGFVIVRRGPRTAGVWLALAAVVFILWFALAVHGTLQMASLLPFSAAIVLGNWIPLAAGLLAGIIGGQEAIPLWRRLVFTTMMVSSAWYTNVLGLSGTAPKSHDLWSSKRVCLQTSTSSCSAASAVMLLRAGGIRSTEHEMIDLCLTGEKGTPPLGLYRGLKAKTAGTEWKVDVVHCDIDELPRFTDTPVLLLITLGGSGESLKDTARRWMGLTPIADHAIVLYRFREDGRAVVGDPSGGGDPSSGRYVWTMDHLREIWSGEGLRLVERSPVSSMPAVTPLASHTLSPAR